MLQIFFLLYKDISEPTFPDNIYFTNKNKKKIFAKILELNFWNIVTRQKRVDYIKYFLQPKLISVHQFGRILPSILLENVACKLRSNQTKAKFQTFLYGFQISSVFAKIMRFVPHQNSKAITRGLLPAVL